MEEARDFLDEQLNVERSKGIVTDVHLMEGVPGRDICGVAKKLEASLIAVNYHKPGGPAGSSTMELIRNCQRDLLVMTRLSSRAVDSSKNAVDNYCTSLFQRVLCPITGDPAPKLKALRSLKSEASIGSVTFLCFSDKIDKVSIAESLNGMGINGEFVMAKSTRREEIVDAAREIRRVGHHARRGGGNGHGAGRGGGFRLSIARTETPMTITYMFVQCP